MKIGVLFDHWDVSKGGAEAATAALVRHLITAGHETHVYGLTCGEYPSGQFHEVEVSETRRGPLDVELAERSLEAARKAGCERILAVRHTPQADVYWPHGGLHVETLSARELVRSTQAFGGLRNLVPPGSRHQVFLELERQVVSDARTRLFAVSRLVAEEIADHFPDAAPRTEVHPNGVDRDRFHPGLREERRECLLRDLGLDDSVPVLLFMGGNWTLKGFPVLVRTLEALAASPWQCVAVGRDSGWAEVRAAAAGLRKRVRFLEPRDPRDLYAVADLLVQPTFRDPCSLATLEALASGVPVLTTTANGAADALRDDYAGSVVSAGDADHLWEALREWLPVIADPTVRATCADAARAQTDDRDYVSWLDRLVESVVA